MLSSSHHIISIDCRTSHAHLLIRVCVQYACVTICACLFCLLSPNVFRRSQTQHFLSHSRTSALAHTRSSVLIWCDRAVILAVLTLWAARSLSLPVSPLLPLWLTITEWCTSTAASSHVYLFACVCVYVCLCVFAILPCSFSQG